MSKPVIYVDMDGVMSDFPSSALRAHGYYRDAALKGAKEGDYDLTEALGMSIEDLWLPINNAGSDFWRNEPEYPWTMPLYEALREIADVVFLTSPSWDPESAKGKMLWLHDRFSHTFRNFIFTNRKDLLAHDKAVLVDDFPSNVQRFRAAGGHAFLFPWAFFRNAPVRVVIRKVCRAVTDVLGEAGNEAE